jgi:DNA topoisomerase-1
MASQMEAAIMEQVAVDIESPDGGTVLRANGSIVKFDGFLKLYQEGKDERAATINDDEQVNSDRDRILPPMSEGDTMNRGPVSPEQHFTKPPPRYTEASLVRKMEELGIGRPSTYASILQVLQDRNYVVLEQRRFTPHDRGRMVVAFLAEFFERYVEYNFTADLEDRLDDVSNGKMEWKALLSDFWGAFSEAIEQTKELRITHVIDKLDAELGPHFFPERDNGSNPRKCPSCESGRLGLKLGRNGGFIGCSKYQEGCGYTTTLRVVTGDEDEDDIFTGPKELGLDPETGLPVSIRKGPFGVYVQLGEAEKGSKAKPKRQSLLSGMVPSDIDLKLALTLLSLPRPVGPHPENGDMIVVGVGRFGPYLKTGEQYVKLGPDDDILTLGLNRAVAIIAEAPARRSNVKRDRKLIGDHPDDGKPIELRDGRYGPYVKHGKINASLPRDMEPEALSLELAIELIAMRAEKVSGKKGAKKKAKKSKVKTKLKAKKTTKTKSNTSPTEEDA